MVIGGLVYNPQFSCSHKHFLYEPGPVSSVLPLWETAHVGYCGKGRGFYCVVVRTVLVYTYFPGIVFIKAPFPKCPNLDHTLFDTPPPFLEAKRASCYGCLI